MTKVSFCDCVTLCLLPCTWRLSCGHGPLGCGAKLLRLFFLVLSFHCTGMGESRGMQHPMSSLASSCPHPYAFILGVLADSVFQVPIQLVVGLKGSETPMSVSLRQAEDEG